MNNTSPKRRPTLTKKHILKQVRRASDTDEAVVAHVVNCFMVVLKDLVTRGYNVEIRDFITIKHKLSRPAACHLRGEKVVYPARRKLKAVLSPLWVLALPPIAESDAPLEETQGPQDSAPLEP